MSDDRVMSAEALRVSMMNQIRVVEKRIQELERTTNKMLDVIDELEEHLMRLDVRALELDDEDADDESD